MHALVEQASTQLEKARLMPVMSAWQEKHCDKKGRRVLQDAAKRCCDGTAILWKESKCADLGDNLEANRQKAEKLCTEFSKEECEFTATPEGAALYYADGWEVGYSNDDAAYSYCARRQERYETLTEMSEREPRTMRRSEHWCFYGPVAEEALSEEQKAQIEELLAGK